jgi:hypothetical protein
MTSLQIISGEFSNGDIDPNVFEFADVGPFCVLL